MEHQIENLNKLGIDDIHIVIGHKAQKIRNFAKENSLKVNFIENKDYLNSNNLFSLWLAKEKLKESFICLNSDVIFDTDILKGLLNQGEDICIAVNRSPGICHRYRRYRL